MQWKVNRAIRLKEGLTRITIEQSQLWSVGVAVRVATVKRLEPAKLTLPIAISHILWSGEFVSA